MLMCLYLRTNNNNYNWNLHVIYNSYVDTSLDKYAATLVELGWHVRMYDYDNTLSSIVASYTYYNYYFLSPCLISNHPS